MRFLLVCDGKSDGYLVQHIRRLLLTIGDIGPDGDVWYRGRRLSDRIQSGLEYSSGVDCLFIHRDAEHPSQIFNRRREIKDAIQDANYDHLWVGIIPVRMTEAWLLLDEGAIRKISGRRNGTNNLGLPRPSAVEGISDPKDELYRVLMEASGATGRRRRQRKQRELSSMRSQLLEDLPVGGDLVHVPSWTRFRDETLDMMSRAETT